jgi:hypothetical protein
MGEELPESSVSFAGSIPRPIKTADFSPLERSPINSTRAIVNFTCSCERTFAFSSSTFSRPSESGFSSSFSKKSR